MASFWRIVGTVVGAMVGWAALQAGGGSPYLLGIFAALLGKDKKVLNEIGLTNH